MKKKHLNSDLICCNFTELSDEEYYECLRWANRTLMKNYYDKQRDGTLEQIDYLYKEKDVSFRGFRHNAGSGQVGENFNKKSKSNPINGNVINKSNETEQKAIKMQGNEVMDGLVNWENTSSDGERFNQQKFNKNGKKTLKSFDIYLKKKSDTAIAKKEAREKVTRVS